jgi:hypothetical protein
MTDTTWPAPWTLKPVHGEPLTGADVYSEIPDDIHWDLSFGFALNVGHDDGEDGSSPLVIEQHFSDADKERGFVKRQVTPEQLERFALLLMAKAARVRREAGR